MKMCRIAGIFLLLVLIFQQAAAAPRIGVVDLERIFREYYKSRIAEETIRRQGDTYRNYMLQLNSQLQRLLMDERSARLNAQNIALDAAGQKQAAEAAETAARLVREKRAEIEMYGKSRSEAMRELEKKKRDEIMADIRSEVRRRAAAEGYDWVFDRSGRTMNDQPSLLVFPERADFTDAVLRELNRTAARPAAEATPLPVRRSEPVAAPAVSSDAPGIVAPGR